MNDLVHHNVSVKRETLALFQQLGSYLREPVSLFSSFWMGGLSGASSVSSCTSCVCLGLQRFSNNALVLNVKH